jgi:hypothetical protein
LEKRKLHKPVRRVDDFQAKLLWENHNLKEQRLSGMLTFGMPTFFVCACLADQDACPKTRKIKNNVSNIEIETEQIDKTYRGFSSWTTLENP